MRTMLAIILICLLISCGAQQNDKRQASRQTQPLLSPKTQSSARVTNKQNTQARRVQNVQLTSGLQFISIPRDNPTFNATFPFPIVAPSMRLNYGAQAEQHADLYIPSQGYGPYPVVVLVHGGCFLQEYPAEMMGLLALDMVSQGYAVWNVEYRRVGSNGGFPNTWSDVGDAVDYLRLIAKQYSLDTKRVIAVGHSAGGPLALWLAKRSTISVSDVLYADDPLPVSAVVSLAGLVDLPGAFQYNLGECKTVINQFMQGLPVDVPANYAAIAVDKISVPQVWVQGTSDTSVPLAYGLETYQKFSPKESFPFVALRNVDHYDLIIPTSAAGPYVRAAVAYLTKSLPIKTEKI